MARNALHVCLSSLLLSTADWVLPAAHAQQLELPLQLTCRADLDAPCIQQEDLVFPLTQTVPLDQGAASLDALIAAFPDEPWTRRVERPRLGVALSGGGSKTAPFAMGVLKRLIEWDELKNVDLLSSVSGGSYAAYYLYSHAWMTKRAREATDPTGERIGALLRPFAHEGADGVPQLIDFYRVVEQNDFQEQRKPTDQPDALKRCGIPTLDLVALGLIPQATQWTENGCAYVGSGDATADRPGPWSHQRYVAAWQDVVSPDPGGESKTTDRGPGLHYAQLFGLTVLSLPVHHVANTLFDWKLELSPVRRAYIDGIATTYGSIPDSGSARTTAYTAATDFTLPELRSLLVESSEDGPLPWWVMSATNKTFRLSHQRDPRHGVFEFTPASFGSGHYGYVRGASFDRIDPSVDVLHAVSATAGFMDTFAAYQPASVPGQALLALLHGTNLRWGMDVPNYRVGPRRRALHRALPLPLYLVDPRFYRSPSSIDIRLADGGMSENNGLYVLLRRGTQQIVVVDGSGDVKGRPYSFWRHRGLDRRYSTLKDLCVMQRTLQESGYDLTFEGYPDAADAQISAGAAYRPTLTEICTPYVVGHRSSTPGVRRSQRSHFNPYRWKQVVWTGWIHPIGQALKLKPDGTCASAASDPMLTCTRIDYLHASLDSDEFIAAMGAWENPERRACPDGESAAGMGQQLAPGGYPCRLVGYRFDEDTKGHRYDVRYWQFPQTSTVWTTADSSHNLYSKYLDLGWFMAGRLACDGSGSRLGNIDRCVEAQGKKGSSEYASP